MANEVAFTVQVQLDTAAIEREAARLGLPLERARAAVIADAECRLHDVLRWRDGLQSVCVCLVRSKPMS
jgi:hypothetical protein